MTDEFREHEWTDEEEAEVQDNLRRCNPFVAVALLVVAAAGLNAAGGCDPISERTVTVAGEVVDADSQEPVDSAWVVVGADTLMAIPYVFTNARGKFSVELGMRGLLPVYVGHAGYQTLTDSVLVSSDVTGLLYELEPVQ